MILGLSRHVPFELLLGNTIFLCPIFDKLIHELIPGSSVIVILWSPNRGHPSHASVGERLSFSNMALVHGLRFDEQLEVPVQFYSLAFIWLLVVTGTTSD